MQQMLCEAYGMALLSRSDGLLEFPMGVLHIYFNAANAEAALQTNVMAPLVAFN